MKSIRSLASTSSTLHRALLTFAAAFVLIAGLLAMHTISTAGTHLESGEVTVAAAHQDLTPQAGVNSATTHGGHCVGDCGDPGDMPSHSLLLMVCAFALLAAAIVVVAPALLAGLSRLLGLAELVRDAPGALSPPRPPSLLVLSISRT